MSCYTARLYGPGDDRTDAFHIRTEVFVKEQGFSPDLEFDSTDPIAWHVVLYDDAAPVATGRLFPLPGEEGVYILGRIAVIKAWRGKDLGAMVMESLEDKARQLGARELQLGAQCQAQGFYSKLGYSPFGELYYDEHCQHIHMKKPLQPI